MNTDANKRRRKERWMLMATCMCCLVLVAGVLINVGLATTGRPDGAMHLLAEASDVELPGGFNLTSVTSIGFAIWYGYYVTKFAIPGIVDKHAAQIERLDAKHQEAMDQANERYQSHVERIVSEFRAELQTLRDSFTCGATPPPKQAA
jgi:t-SNARE complex subunit (syntaxin)